MMTELKDKFTVEKAILINLKDYPNGKKVSIVKIKKDDKSMLVISDTL
jgi:hypothetical protein